MTGTSFETVTPKATGTPCITSGMVSVVVKTSHKPSDISSLPNQVEPGSSTKPGGCATSSKDLLPLRCLWVPDYQATPAGTPRCPTILHLVGVGQPVLTNPTNRVGALPHQVWHGQSSGRLWSAGMAPVTGQILPCHQGHQSPLV